MQAKEKQVIERIWAKKEWEDSQNLVKEARSRNIEPIAGETLYFFARGTRAKRILEIGGSTGLSTIFLAAAARDNGGRVYSLELLLGRVEQARYNLRDAGLEEYVEHRIGDAYRHLPELEGKFDFVLLDCEKPDYLPFLKLVLDKVEPGTFIFADNVISHQNELLEFLSFMKSELYSMVIPVGKVLAVGISR